MRTTTSSILERLAPDAPVEEDWDDVLRRAGDATRDGSQKARRSRRVLIAALVAGVAVVVAGTAFAVRFSLFASSPPSGFEVARAGGLTLRADVGACGVAVFVYDGARFVAGAGGMPVIGAPQCKVPPQPPATHSVGYLVGDAGTGRIMVAGVVAPGVARLSITPRHGAVFGVPLHRAPAVLHTRLEFFVTVVRGHARSLAPSPIRFFTTYAADDRPIERFTIPR